MRGSAPGGALARERKLDCCGGTCTGGDPPPLVAALAAVVLIAFSPSIAFGAVNPLKPPDPFPSPGGRDPGARQPHAPAFDSDTILVRFTRGAGAAARTRALAAIKGRAHTAVRRTSFEVVQLTGGDPRAALTRIRNDPSVAAAQLNYTRRKAAQPDDPLFVKGRQDYLRTLRFPAVWDRVRAGATDVVAILDTGVDLDQPDLAAQLQPGYDFVDDDANPDDDEGHGTAVASIAAAQASNGAGMAGAAWSAGVLPVKVLDSSGSGTDSMVAEGITWAADRGADVINLSLGGAGESPVLADAVAYARSHGAVVVAAAGNDMTDEPSYPAATPGVLAVSATNWSGDFAALSNYGAWIDLAAPGTGVLGAQIAPDGGAAYRAGSGTSFAAPLVAATALLVRAQGPGLTPAQVEDRLLATARDAGPAGRDPYYGAGLVDPLAAVGGTPEPPLLAPAGDGNDTIERATPAVVQGFTSGSITRQGDLDWYSLDITRPGEYILRLVPKTEASYARTEQLDGVITTYGPSHQPIDNIDAPGFGAVDVGYAHFPTVGRYYARVANYAGSRGGAYQLSVAYNAGLQQPRFLPADLDRTPALPASAAIADVTGDGVDDALVMMRDGFDAPSDELLVYPSTPAGTYGEPIGYDTGARSVYDLGAGKSSSFVMDVSTGDVDGDGATDAAVAVGRWIAVFYQRNGTLVREPVPGTQGADHVEIADVDGDGRNDLVAVVTYGASDGVQVFRNTGGGFEMSPVSAYPYPDIDVGDVDGDGRLDVVGVSAGVVDVMRQQAAGGFTSERISTATEECVALGDVTGDGIADIVHTTPGDASGVVVRAGRRGDSPAAPVSYPKPYRMEAIEIADYDGDGRPDVVGAAQGRVEFRRQQAGGTLGPEEVADLESPSDYLATSLAVGDLTGDGALDAIVSDGSWEGIWTVRQRTDSFPLRPWILDTTPYQEQRGVRADVTPVLHLGRPLRAASVSAQTVRLESAEGATVPAAVAYDAAGSKVTVTPGAALAAGAPYVLRIDGVVDSRGNRLTGQGLRFTTAGSSRDTSPPDTTIRWAPIGTNRESDAWIDAFSSEPGARLECSLDAAAFAECALPVQLRTLADGTHTLRVRAVDAAGNADPTPASRTWTLAYGTVPRPPNDPYPYPQDLTGASGTVRASNVGAESDDPGGDLWVTADNPGGASLWYTWTPPADGMVEIDTAGSDFDTLLGVFTGDRSSSEAVRRRADSDDVPGALTSRVRLYVRADTRYRIVVDGWSDDLHASSGNFVLNWSLQAGRDTAPPETTISDGPPATATSSPRTFFFSSSEPDSSFECKIDTQQWFACSSPRPLWFNEDGSHVVSVRASDPAGNVDPTPATWSFTSDVHPPETWIASYPVSPATPDVSIAFTSSEPESTFECSLDRSAWESCSSPQAYSGLAPGPYRFRVRARDRWGHVDDSPAYYDFTVPNGQASDKTPPDTQITAGPNASTSATSAVFEFTSELDARFECRLDDGAWAECWSPKSYAQLGTGGHSFAVRAVDAAGNRDATPAERSWTIVDPGSDTVPPDTILTSSPPPLTRSASASFEFHATEPGSSLACALDGGGWSPCSSPYLLDGLADGAHSLTVRATDAAGNADPSPASAGWRVDTVAPVTSIESGPQGVTSDSTPTFAFAAGEPVAGYECRIDSEPFVECSSPYTTAPLAVGAHTFAARATDLAGNVEQSPPTQAFEVAAAEAPAGSPGALPPPIVSPQPGDPAAGGVQGVQRRSVPDPPPRISNIRAGPRPLASARGRNWLRVRFTLSEKAAVTVFFERAVRGVMRSGRCRPVASRGLAQPGRCTVFTRVRGSFGHGGARGVNRIAFGGGVRPLQLRPGRYRFVIVAVDSARQKTTARGGPFVVTAKVP